MALGDGIISAFNRLQGGLGDMLQRLAVSGVQHIKERTLSGRDVKGAPFRAYSPKYAQRKGQQRVDLYSNNRVSKRGRHMLDDMGVMVGGETGTFDTMRGGATGRFRGTATGRFESARTQEVSIGFNDPKSTMIAWAQITGVKTGKPRDFFGLPKAWVQENVDREFRSLFDRTVSRSLSREEVKIKVL